MNETWKDHHTSWEKEREAILEKYGYVCVSCGAKAEDVYLECHHALSVDKKYNYEMYVPRDKLFSLCRECHDVITDLRRNIRYKKNIITETPNSVNEVSRIEIQNKDEVKELKHNEIFVRPK